RARQEAVQHPTRPPHRRRPRHPPRRPHQQPGGQPGEVRPMPRLSDDPDLAAHLRRPANVTGIPVTRCEQWSATPPPPRSDPADWVDALTATARQHQPWTDHALAELARMAASVPPRADAA